MKRVSDPIPPSSVIQTAADITAGIAHLIAACPGMAKAHAAVGDPPLRRWPAGFAGLVRIVTGQQLSTASANAIHARVLTTVVPLSPQALLATDPAHLKATGLSAGKIATLRAVASAVVDGQLDFEHLAVASANDVTHQLTLFIAKNLERVGDHATNIAEMVYYAATGQHLVDRPRGGDLYRT